MDGLEIIAYANTNGFTLELSPISKTQVEQLAFLLELTRNNLSITNAITYARCFLKERSPYFLVKTLALTEDGTCSPIRPQISRIGSELHVTLDCGEESADYARVLLNFEKYVNAAIYDTTSHSKQAQTNVVYSNHASLGYTPFWGDVWYYVRLEPTQLTSLQIGNMINARLNFYRFSEGSPSIVKKRMVTQWCSFTTLWNNKLDGITVTDGDILPSTDDFISFDFTKEAEEIHRKCPDEDYGNLIVPSRSEQNASVTICTADNTNHPVFVEVTYSV